MLEYPVTVRHNVNGKVMRTTVSVDSNLLRKAKAKGQTVEELLSMTHAVKGVTLLDVGQPVPTTLADQADKCAAQRRQECPDKESFETTQDMYAAIALETSSRIKTIMDYGNEHLNLIPSSIMYLPLGHASYIDVVDRQMLTDYVKTTLEEVAGNRNGMKELAKLTAQNRSQKDQYFEKMRQVLGMPLPEDEYQRARAMCPTMSEDDYLTAEKTACETLFNLCSKFCCKVLPTVGSQTINTCDEKFLFSEDEIMTWIADMEASGKAVG